MKITAEEFFRNKIKELNPNQEVITLSRELINGDQWLRWAHEFKELHTKELKDEIERLKESKLYAFQPDGHGQMSFFVMSESELKAKESINKYISENYKPKDYYTNGWGSDYYKLTTANSDNVVENDNS